MELRRNCKVCGKTYELHDIDVNSVPVTTVCTEHLKELFCEVAKAFVREGDVNGGT